MKKESLEPAAPAIYRQGVLAFSFLGMGSFLSKFFMQVSF